MVDLYRTPLPHGDVFPERISKFGRAVADGDIVYVPEWEAKRIIKRKPYRWLRRMKVRLEARLDELTWDLEAISDPGKAARVRKAISDIRAILGLIEDRLARWERLSKVSYLRHH